MKRYIKNAKSAFFTAVSAVSLLAAAPAHADPLTNQGTWEATLFARDINGDGKTDAFFDKTLNITWLANANASGPRTFDEATTWTSALAVGSNVGWRLPTVLIQDGTICTGAVNGPVCGYNFDTANSEIAHLFYVTLGNEARLDTSGEEWPAGAVFGLTNTGNFLNMQRNVYWSSSKFEPDATFAWRFDADDGLLLPSRKTNVFFVMAVHDGDVTVAGAIPEPETYAMMLAGLGLLGAIARRNKAKQTA